MRERITQIKGRLTARPSNVFGLDRPNAHEDMPFHNDDSDGILFVPSTFDPRARVPLLVMLHGAGLSASDAMLVVQSAAEERGVIVFAPQSQGITWDIIRGAFGSDFATIDKTLKRLFDDCQIDPIRVAIGGFSDGASYALTLGLLNGDLFRTVLAFSPGFSLAEQVIGRPQITISHGRQDPVLPYDLCGSALARVLTQHGLDVRFDPFDGGHTVPFAQVAGAMDWWLGR